MFTSPQSPNDTQQSSTDVVACHSFLFKKSWRSSAKWLARQRPEKEKVVPPITRIRAARRARQSGRTSSSPATSPGRTAASWPSGTLLGVGRWKAATSGAKIARMPVHHMREPQLALRRSSTTCAAATLNWKQRASSDDNDSHRTRALTSRSCTTARSSRTPPDFQANLSRTVRTTVSSPHSKLLYYEIYNLLAGPEVFLNRPKAVRATRKMSFTE